MDGWTLLRDVRELLNESDTSLYLSDRTTYDYLYEAACELNRRIYGLTSTQTITTVDGTNTYSLNEDFMGLYIKDIDGRFTLKINDGTSDYWITRSEYSSQYIANNTDEVAIPDTFSINDASLASRIVSTATAAGTSSNGECTLTDATAPFTNVSVGDLVHNTTDGSHGVVVAITSTSAVVTALFEGTNNDWTNADAYIITPRGRYQIVLDPTPSTSGYSLYVPYLQKPAPVYSDYRSYRFPEEYRFVLSKYASWLYKYRDREPNYGDAWYKAFDMISREVRQSNNKVRQSHTLKVQLKRDY
jgi:hypothetical protein